MRTFIATATDPRGHSIRREVRASDKAAALAQLRGLGLTSIRLHELLPSDDTRKASLLRPASSSEAEQAAEPRRPVRRLCEDTIRVDVFEMGDETVVRKAEPPAGDAHATQAWRSSADATRRRRRDDETLEVELVEEGEQTFVRGPVAGSAAEERPPAVADARAATTIPPAPPQAPTRPSAPVAPSRPAAGTTTPSAAGAPPVAPPATPSAAGAPLVAPPATPSTTPLPRQTTPLPRATTPLPHRPAPPAAARVPSPARDRSPRPRQPTVDLERARLSPVDRMAFFSALANMLNAGIPLLRCITSMEEQFTHPVTRAVMARLGRRLGEGGALSDAMASMPRAFTRLQIGSVRGGEKTGKLPMVLTRLFHYEERSLSLTRQLKSVLTYPLVVFGCSLVLVLFVGRSLVTGMSPALAQAGVQVNAVTRLVMSMSRALDHPLGALLFLAACAAIAWLAARWLSSPVGQDRRDRFVMHAPVLRNTLRMVETSRICEAMAALYGSGLTILQCLDVAADACGNVMAREALEVVRGDLREGLSLSDGLARSGFFDKTVVQMVAVGEETGKLDMAFSKVAQYNDLEVRSALDQLAAAIEPLMFVVLGVVVGIIALVAFGPLYQLMGSLA